MTSQLRPAVVIRLLCLSICLSLCLSVHSQRAVAAEATEGAAPADSTFAVLYERASAAYKERRYAAAVTDLLTAYKLQPEPRLLFNIAQSYRKMGELQKARQFFEQYLEADKDASAETRSEVRDYLVELAVQKQAAALPARISPTPTPDGPPPYRMARWQKVLGALLVIGGGVGLASGSTFLALDGQCTAAPIPPAAECGRIYQLLAPGAAQIAVGGGLFTAGVLTLVLPAVKERRARAAALVRSRGQAHSRN